MSVFDLYKQEKFHQLILCPALCTTKLDFVCLYLSLAAIGRKRVAIVLLRALAESSIDPSDRICILLCLHELTGVYVFKVEAKYWQSLGDFDDATFRSLQPLPQYSDRGPSTSFSQNGAAFDPHSYSYTWIEDKRVAAELRRVEDHGLALFEVIANCGSTVCITKILRLKKMEKRFWDAEIKLSGYDYNPFNDLLENLAVAKQLSAIAGYHHLIGNSSKALEHCTKAILWINSIQLQYKSSRFKGALDYEKESLVMMASDHLSVSSEDTYVESLLNELIYPHALSSSPAKCTGPTTNSFHHISHATSLRQSQFFASCGNIHRAMAIQSSTPFAFMYRAKKYRGIVYNRNDLLETSRKFVIAAALQPVDNPYLHLHYNRVIWCLMFCGGIDLHVILLFFTVRNYFLHYLLFTLIEDSSESPMKKWPEFSEGPEILERIFDLCIDALQKELHVTHNLLPTTIECGNDVIFLKNYVSMSRIEDSESLRDIDNLDSRFQESIPDSEICHLMSSSQEIAKLWTSTFCQAHGRIPEEIEKVTQYLDL